MKHIMEVQWLQYSLLYIENGSDEVLFSNDSVMNSCSQMVLWWIIVFNDSEILCIYSVSKRIIDASIKLPYASTVLYWYMLWFIVACCHILCGILWILSFIGDFPTFVHLLYCIWSFIVLYIVIYWVVMHNN